MYIFLIYAPKGVQYSNLGFKINDFIEQFQLNYWPR